MRKTERWWWIGGMLAIVMVVGCREEQDEPGDSDEISWEYADPYEEQEWARWSQDKPSLLAVDEAGGLVFGDWAGNLQRVDAEDGSIDWQVPLEGTINAAVAIEDEVIYVGDWSGTLTALSLTGDILWSYSAGAKLDQSPSVDGEGRVWIGDDDGFLHIVEEGQAVDTLDLEAPVTSAASIDVFGGETTIYVATADDRLHCIDGEGERRVAALSGQVGQDIALSEEGLAVVTTHNGGAAIVDQDCEIRWENSFTYATMMPAVLGANDEIWAWAHRRRLYRLSMEDGEVVEQEDGPIRANATTAAVMTADGEVLLSTEGLIAFQNGDWHVQSPIDAMDSPLLVDGGAFVTTHRGALVRLAGPWPSLSTESSWPTQHGNQRRTGRLER